MLDFMTIHDNLMKNPKVKAMMDGMKGKSELIWNH